MRAMPSPTSSTRPTSRPARRSLYLTISCSRTETISSGLNLMTAALQELVPNARETGADGRIVQPIADLHNQAADQVGIDAGFQHGFAVKGVAELVQQPLALVVGERDGAANLHAHAAGAAVANLPRLRQDGPDDPEPLVLVEHEEEVDQEVAGAPAQRPLDQVGLGVAADGPAGQECLVVRVGR